MAENLKLGDNITRVSWNGWTIRGPNTNLTMLEMKSMLDLSYREIGKVFNVSYQTVCNRFAEVKEDYPDLWAEAESKKRFYDNFKALYYDCDGDLAPVAKKLNITVGKARKLRAELIPREERQKKVSVGSRQNILSHSLFGYDVNAGVNFESQLAQWFKLVDKEIRQRLTEYYLEGNDTEIEARHLRHKDLNELREKMQELNLDKEQLIQENILCHNRRL